MTVADRQHVQFLLYRRAVITESPPSPLKAITIRAIESEIAQYNLQIEEFTQICRANVPVNLTADQSNR